jgi:hypothetical protein
MQPLGTLACKMSNKNVETLHCDVSMIMISIENYAKFLAGWVFIYSYGDVMYYVSTKYFDLLPFLSSQTPWI